MASTEYRSRTVFDSLRLADDCNALYDSGLVRVGTDVEHWVNGTLQWRSSHDTEWDAIGAYLLVTDLLGL